MDSSSPMLMRTSLDTARHTVLLVEDNEDIALSLRLVLEEEGYVVQWAANGKEALDLLARIPAPSLALVDLMMPVMDGWQLLEALAAHATLHAMPVAITSAAADLAPLGYPLFRKPLDLDRLLAFIERLCDLA